MRFLHLADLHLGKMLCGLSLLTAGDQPAWVEKLLSLTEETKPDAVVIAGDVYDRGMPSGGAVQLLSRLVTALAEMGLPVLIAAGNHDSGQRLDCFRDILSRQKVYISGVLRRELTHVTLHDEYGPVTFWLLPYTFPAAAAQVLADESITDYDTAVRRILAAQDMDPSARNVIVAHQNVTVGGKELPRGGSETVVGGVGQVEHTAFDAFDYAALGHIHAAYAVGRETVRYAGSPMCYHFDEIRQPEKGPLLVTLGEKGAPVQTETLHIPPLHPLRELRGTYAELLRAAGQAGQGEYVKLVLTDRPLTPDVSAYFQAVFEARGSVLMERGSVYQRFAGPGDTPEAETLRDKSVDELFADFYTDRSGGESPTAEDAAVMRYAAELLRDPSGGGAEAAEKLLAYIVRGGDAS